MFISKGRDAILIESGLGIWGSRDSEAVRWQQNWPIEKLLVLRYADDINQKEQLKCNLHPLLVLNIRSIILGMPKKRSK